MTLLRTALLTLLITTFGVCAPVHAATGQSTSPQAADPKYQAMVDEAAALIDRSEGSRSDLAAAKEKLDRVLRAAPNTASAHREYVRYHIGMGHIEGLRVKPESLTAAERSLDAALRINPQYAEAYVLAGHLYFLQNRIPEALKALDKAKAIGTSDPWLPLNIATIQASQGKLSEATANYQAVIDGKTKNRKAMGAALEGLIDMHIKAGQLAKADDTHKRLLAYAPDSAWSHGNYAAFLLCHKDDADAATLEFKQALALMNYGMARAGLAASLYRKWAMEAKDRQPSPASPLYREAQALTGGGDPREVVYWMCGHSPTLNALNHAMGLPPPR